MSDNDYAPLIESTIAGSGPSAATQATDTLRAANQRVSEAIDSGRAPGAPLDTIVRLVREAPLHSLTIAFLLGMVVARRRSERNQDASRRSAG
jgi:plasmid stabilization system protein ParE